MKKINIIILIILLIFLVSCKKAKEIDKGELEETIFITSDIHLLSNNLVDETVPKIRLTTDGRCQELDYDLVNALVDKINLEKPNYFVITGDLSFNGELDSHNELIRLLGRINSDTKILVLPGNHDCNSLNSYSYLNGVVTSVDNISVSSFPIIYKSFGYTDAYSKDEGSNSYIYKLSETKWAVLLDTNLSAVNEEVGYNVVLGNIYDDTYEWLENNLSYAKENNIEVISFSHHSLITHNKMFESNYTIRSYERLQELYRKYNVVINFSGHLHIQNIKENNGVYDIASGGLLDYGNRYGVLKIYSKAYEYKSYKLSLEDIDLESYSFNTFYTKYYNKTTLDSNIYKEKTDKVKELMSKMNAYYFDGSYSEILKLQKEYKEYYDVLKDNNTSGYFEEILNYKSDSNNLLVQK